MQVFFWSEVEESFFNAFDPSISLHRSTTFEATQSVIAEIFKNRWEWLKLRSRLYKPWASHIMLHLETTKTTTNKTCTSLLRFADLKITITPKQFKAKIWNKRRKIEDVICLHTRSSIFMSYPPTKNKTKKLKNIKHSEQNIKIEIT